MISKSSFPQIQNKNLESNSERETDHIGRSRKKYSSAVHSAGGAEMRTSFSSRLIKVSNNALYTRNLLRGFEMSALQILVC